ncbi:MAG: hypothetical protein H0W87_05065 [Actinobacteria bacterium]|nr:hypothetical protein [Actinomycetota bacterium]
MMVTACASHAPSQTLKAENKRLRNELADARSQQADIDAKLKALQSQLAQLDQAAKAKDIELAKLRTETSASWREVAEARGRTAAADKRVPIVQCPQGTILDATGSTCVAAVSVSTLVDGDVGAVVDGSRSRSGARLGLTGMGIGYQRVIA